MLPHKLRMSIVLMLVNLKGFFPFQSSEVSEHFFRKSAVTGSHTETANDPVTTGKNKEVLKESNRE